MLQELPPKTGSFTWSSADDQRKQDLTPKTNTLSLGALRAGAKRPELPNSEMTGI